MYPHGFNNRGGFSGITSYRDRTPTRASSFISTQANRNRQNPGQGGFVARAQNAGIRVADPADDQGGFEHSGHEDPDKTPTQASVTPYTADKHKTLTQASPFTLPQRTSSIDSGKYEAATKELEMMVKKKPEHQKGGYQAMAHEMLRQFVASNAAACANTAALGAHEPPPRSTTNTLGGDLASPGGGFRGHELGLPTHKASLGGSTTLLGSGMMPLGGSETAHGGNKPVPGGDKWLVDFGYGKTAQAGPGAAGAFSPLGTTLASYGPPHNQVHAEPELRRAFKVASDRKKLSSDQAKAMPGLDRAVSFGHEPGSAYEKHGSAYEKHGSAYEKHGSAHEKPSSAHGKAGSDSDMTADREKLLTELRKEVYDRSSAAYAVSDATWARSNAAADSGHIADEASKNAAAHGYAGSDNKQGALVHRKAAAELKQLGLRHASSGEEHERAAQIHKRMGTYLEHLTALHERAFQTHEGALANQADAVRTGAPRADEAIAHHDAAALPRSGALSHPSPHRGGAALAPTAHREPVQTIDASRSRFQRVLDLPRHEADRQRRATGPADGATANASTQRRAPQTQEQAFASRAQAHGIRIRSTAPEKKDPKA